MIHLVTNHIHDVLTYAVSHITSLFIFIDDCSHSVFQRGSPEQKSPPDINERCILSFLKLALRQFFSFNDFCMT